MTHWAKARLSVRCSMHLPRLSVSSSTPLLQVGKRRSRASWLKQPEFTLLNYQQHQPRCPMFARFSPTRSIIWTQMAHQRSSSSMRSIGSPSRNKMCCSLVSNTALSDLSVQRQRTLASLSTAHFYPGALSSRCQRSPMTTSTRSSSGPFIIQMDWAMTRRTHPSPMTFVAPSR